MNLTLSDYNKVEITDDNKYISYWCINDEHDKCKGKYLSKVNITLYGKYRQHYICSCQCHKDVKKDENK